jgi:predicted kinase
MTSRNPLAKPRSILIVFGGLPGTGKSSIARELAARMDALYLRIDTIEQAIRNSPGVSRAINEEGYRVAYAVAEDNLRLGRTVISDSVNPIQETRDAWMEVACLTKSFILEVEVICSDPDSHRHRVETRETTISGLKLPTWEDVLCREYQPWNRDRIVTDTAHKTVADCVNDLQTAITLRMNLTKA